MEKAKYRISCPVCGRLLCRSIPNSYLEGNCPKCASYIRVYVRESGVDLDVITTRNTKESSSESEYSVQ